MPFDYSIKPCSSAKPVTNSDRTSPNFGKVIQPIRYNGVGCPAVILNSSDKVVCNNGDIFNTLPITDKNYFTGIESNLTNRFNRINFNIGQTVYVENILTSLGNIFSGPAMELFLIWNPKLVEELNLIRGGCSSSSHSNLKGRIAAITENIFGSGRIWWDVPLLRNINTYPDSYPKEIFWLELFNGDELGLQNFNIGKKVRDAIYYQEIKLSEIDGSPIIDNTQSKGKYYGVRSDKDHNIYEWEDKIKIDELPNFNGRQLYPVLRSQISNLQTRMLVQGTNAINRSQIMNTPRFRSRGSCTTGSLCLDTTLTPSFKNSTKNMYLAPIPYGQRLGNIFRSSQIRGTKKIVRKNCIDPQFGRLVGTGGARLVNKF